MSLNKLLGSRTLLVGAAAVLLMVVLYAVQSIGAAQAAADSFDWQDTGNKAYGANCAACHQGEGQGVPSAFPNLAGHLPDMVAKEGGRALLPQIVLFGMQGAIKVGDADYNGLMPAWQQLTDEEIAATLNHELTSWGNQDKLPKEFQLYTPADITAARATTMTSDQVHAAREKVMGAAN